MARRCAPPRVGPLGALEQALYARQPADSDALIHHSDRGSQYVSIRYTERLAEVIYRRSAWKSRKAVELATLEWVAWYKHVRLMQPLGYIPPEEAEANYYRQHGSQSKQAA